MRLYLICRIQFYQELNKILYNILLYRKIMLLVLLVLLIYVVQQLQ